MNKVTHDKKATDLSSTGKMCFANGAISNRGMGSSAEKSKNYPIVNNLIVNNPRKTLNKR
ncbi:MAG: hypothetical protein DRQ89_11690 [Epsilonproteobacteria bacterium]|nr:MAG: hypothetical protein DRQ89_11690 [Campylobacterota bacterium]